MTMTTRLCLNALKRRDAETHRRMAWEEEATEFEWWEEVPTPEEIWWATEQRLFVRRLLMTLPPPQRAALLLRYGELMSYLLLAAWVSFLSALFPEWVKLKAQTVQTKSVRAFLFGLIVVLLLGVVGAILGGIAKHFPPAGVLVVLLFLSLLTPCALG